MMNYTDFSDGATFNGVLCVSAEYFGQHLAEYLRKHPARKVTAIVPVTRAPGYTEGYWIITEPKGI